MTIQEKFDSIINCIERLVCEEDYDIPQTISRETGLNLRLLGDAFQFITDITLIKYIRQRRLVNALMRRNEFNLPIEQVASDAGFSDAAAFSKACKNEFNLSPSQITENILKEYTPLYFSRVISGKEEKMENDTLITAKKNDSICGISAEQFAEVKQVLEIGAIYGLTDEEAEFVYRLAKHCKVTSAQAAEFFDDYKLQIENGSILDGLSIYDMAELSFAFNLSFSESQSILYEIGCHGYESIHDLPKGFFDIYFSEYNEKLRGYDVQYICEILSSMEENGFSTDEIDDILDGAMFWGVDPIELIENYDEYTTLYEKIAMDLCGAFSDDNTDGFEYMNTWEISKE